MNLIDLSPRDPDWTDLRILLSLSLRQGRGLQISGAGALITADPSMSWTFQQLTGIIHSYGAGEISIKGDDLLCLPAEIPFGIYDMELDSRTPLSELILLLAPALFSREFRSVLNLTGATHAQAGVPVSYMRETLFSAMAELGFPAGVNMARFGFYARGGGELEARIYPERPVSRAAPDRFSFRRISGARVYFAGLDGAEASSQKALLASLLKIPEASVSILDIMNSPGIHSSIYVFTETERYPLVFFREIQALTPDGEPVYTRARALEECQALAEEALAFTEKGTLAKPLMKELVPYLVISGSERGGLSSSLAHLADLCEKIIFP